MDRVKRLLGGGRVHASESGSSTPSARIQPTFELPPPRPPFSSRPPRILIIGGGSRGSACARAIISCSNGLVAAVAEPVEFKRKKFGQKYVWGVTSPDEGMEFVGWEQFVEWEAARRERVKSGESGVPDGVDAAIICTLDKTHREIIEGLAHLSLHILCEKPLATTLDDCIRIYASLLPDRPTSSSTTLFSIGHILRYAPRSVLLRKLIWEDGAIGDIVSVQHTEEVGWWHFAHSYVRGNWRKQSTNGPSLLTKCCHDIDFLLWLLSPPHLNPGDSPHFPSTLSSSGSVMYFKPSRKPKLAGTATNCLSCAAEPDCRYSAKKQYIDRGIMDAKSGWPVDVVVPDIEQHLEHGLEYAQNKVLDRLAEDYTVNDDQQTIDSRGWYGRCVYESDNDVCDDQVVTISWEDDFPDEETNRDRPRGRGAKTATLHMTAFSNPISSHRRTRIFCTQGEITADSDSITVRGYDSTQTTTHHPPLAHGGHNGGDEGLIRGFVLGVDAVKNHGMNVSEAQKTHIGGSIEGAIRSHALIFAAEEARVGKKVLNWKQWWEEVVEAKLRTLKSQPIQSL